MNLPVKKSDLAVGLQRSAAMAAKGTGGDHVFLKLAKSGNWVFGSDATPVADGTLWAVNPFSAQHGYIAWSDSQSEPLGEVMVPVQADLPTGSALPQVDGRWDLQLSINMICVKGPQKDTNVLYASTSVGGRKALTNLFSDIASVLQSGSDAFVPVVALNVDSYKHKKYGQIFTPILDVRQWNDMDDTEVEGEEAPPEPEVKPKRSRVRNID